MCDLQRHQEGNQLLKADEPELAIERYEGALEVLGRVGADELPAELCS